MCYVVAKDANKTGCIALRMEHGKALVDLKREIKSQVGYSRIQLVTISRPSAYGEYAPYKFVESTEEFKQAVYHL